MSDKTITILVTKNYGNLIAMPVCDQGKLFAKLAKSKSLTVESLQILKQLGYIIVQTGNTIAI